MLLAADRLEWVRTRLAEALSPHRSGSSSPLATAIALIAETVGCEAAGIRLVDEHGAAPFVAEQGIICNSETEDGRISSCCERCRCAEVLSAQAGADGTETTIEPLHFNSARSLREALAVIPGTLPPQLCALRSFESIALVPIHGAGFPLGWLHCADRRPRRFAAEDLELLTACADEIGRFLFFDSIWPGSGMTVSPAQETVTCPVCARHREPTGTWTLPATEGEHHWTARPPRLALCPDCLPLQFWE